MGVSGSGKTTIGQALAERLAWDFADADDFHSPANVQRMARGEALTDADRAPWLQQLRRLIDVHLAEARPLVLTCSALKQRYRVTLGCARDELQLIYLHGTFDQLYARMQHRSAHFMPPSQLRNQLDTLEEPSKTAAHWLAIDQPIDQQVAQLLPLFLS